MCGHSARAPHARSDWARVRSTGKRAGPRRGLTDGYESCGFVGRSDRPGEERFRGGGVRASHRGSTSSGSARGGTSCPRDAVWEWRRLLRARSGGRGSGRGRSDRGRRRRLAVGQDEYADDGAFRHGVTVGT